MDHIGAAAFLIMAFMVTLTVQQGFFPNGGLFGGNGFGAPYGNNFNNPLQSGYPGQGGYPGNLGYGNNYNQRPPYNNFQPGVGNQYGPNNPQAGYTSGRPGTPSYGQSPSSPTNNNQLPYNSNQYPGNPGYNNNYNRYPNSNNGVHGQQPVNNGAPNQYGNRPPNQHSGNVPVDQTTSNGYRPSNQQYGNGNGQSRVPSSGQQLQPNYQQPSNGGQYGNNYNRNPSSPQDVRQGPTKPSTASVPEAQKSSNTNTPAWNFFEPENSNVKN